MTTKRALLWLIDTTLPEDQQEPKEYTVEMPEDYVAAEITWEDIKHDGAVRIVDEEDR